MVNKVLIVDDQTVILDALVQVLTMHGYETEIAIDGRAGIRKLIDFEPDLVITDLLMPNMDGMEFSKIARMLWDGPIIMLTGVHRTEGDDFELGLVDDYIVKPVEMSTLVARIESMLNDSPPKNIGICSGSSVARKIPKLRVLKGGAA